jgi:hypothetical protein
MLTPHFNGHSLLRRGEHQALNPGECRPSHPEDPASRSGDRYVPNTRSEFFVVHFYLSPSQCLGRFPFMETGEKPFMETSLWFESATLRFPHHTQRRQTTFTPRKWIDPHTFSNSICIHSPPKADGTQHSIH